MPVPCHAPLRDNLPPQHPSSEHAPLEQRARVALASERGCRGVNLASLRVACAIGLLLIALCALASKASAMPPRVTDAEGTSAAATPPNQITIRPSETFDWAAASVGAGFTAALALLVAGGALVLSRRRAHRPVAADNRY